MIIGSDPESIPEQAEILEREIWSMFGAFYILVINLLKQRRKNE